MMRTPRLPPFRPGLGRTAALVAFLQALVFAGAAVAEELYQPISSGLHSYEETLLRPEPVEDGALPLEPEPYCSSGYCEPAPEPPPFYSRFRGGGSYFDSSSDDRLGGAYGLDVIVPISKAIGGFGSISANHFSGGTQYLATVGILKGIPMNRGPFGFHTIPYPQTPLEEAFSRINYTVLFDQFSDSRVSGLYVSQIRSSLSYSFYEDAAVGMQYTKPIQRDVVQFITPAANPINVPLEFGEAISVYGSGWFGDTQLTGSIGYRDGVNAVTYNGNARRRLSERVTAFVNANYVEEGLWATFAGFEIALGPSPGCSAGCCQREFEGDVVRGQPLTEEQIRQEAYESQAYIEGLCGVPAIKYRNRRNSSDPFDDPGMSEPLNGTDVITVANSIRGMDRMLQVQRMMDAVQNGGFNGDGIDFTADCDTLVTQLLAANNGNIAAVIDALVTNQRTECLGDPRLMP